ncbi:MULTISPECIES: hypothetical protein [Rhizobium]|nr:MULTISPECIES: hypothetical protein [Rhizobium]
MMAVATHAQIKNELMVIFAIPLFSGFRALAKAIFSLELALG